MWIGRPRVPRLLLIPLRLSRISDPAASKTSGIPLTCLPFFCRALITCVLATNRRSQLLTGAPRASSYLFGLRIHVMSRASSYQEETVSSDAFLRDAYASHSGNYNEFFRPNRGSQPTLTPT